MRRIAICVVALCLAVAAVAWADPADDYIRAQLQEFSLPGLSLAVVRDGVIVKSDGYGMADRDRKVPAARDTVYKIGSVSKQFIATGIMLLVQDKLLRLDDPIRKYLEQTPSSWTPITIRHLLAHTSGLVRESPAFTFSKNVSDAELLGAASQSPSAFRAGREVGVFEHGLRGARRDHSHRGAPAVDGLSASDTLRARRDERDASHKYDRAGSEPRARLWGNRQ